MRMGGRKKIIIVDDDRETREMLKMPSSWRDTRSPRRPTACA